MRGQDVTPFKALPSTYILVPQRGMNGDPNLSASAPKTYAFLRRFRAELETRSSLRRFQPDQPWYSLWSAGPYTFAPQKVVWREMSGGDLFAAYAGTQSDPLLGERVIVPDHKLYFIQCPSQAEAMFLVGFLNAPLVRAAINSYASALSLGTSVADYVGLPQYDPDNATHDELAQLACRLSRRSTAPDATDQRTLDKLVRKLLRRPAGRARDAVPLAWSARRG